LLFEKGGITKMTNRLKEIRARNRVTQFELRLKTGIHQSKISMAENNYIELTEREKAKIARALGVSANEIWGDGSTE
jgi:transcriptional regulator with XRE-family HTH domain